jgi:hypothetical protein
MAEYCPNCFEAMDFLHTCDSSKSSEAENFGNFVAPKSKRASLITIVGLAPLAGLAVDLFAPLPSSVVHSILATLIGSTLVGLIWVMTSYDGHKSAKFLLRNLKNFAYTPNMLKVFSAENPKKATTTWFGALALSIALQLVVFTPGNASYLGHQVTKKIDDASGANLEVKCPSTKIYLYNEKIECRVKTGLLGITVPARATLSPIIGSAEIKVSLF